MHSKNKTQFKLPQSAVKILFCKRLQNRGSDYGVEYRFFTDSVNAGEWIWNPF